MKIKTITCHDVYNAGASLQAYALMKYLQNLGHEVEIIDYKPDYLSHHYELFYVANSRYQNIIFKIPYLLIKFPRRLINLFSKRKKNYDLFTKKYLNLTKRYNSYNELLNDCPEADLFIAGSDQIWNNIFPNGKDPAFYLQFVKDGTPKVSYAASFATSKVNYQFDENVKQWLNKLDKVSIREKSAIEVLNDYQIYGKQVMDPVFLLDKSYWEKLCLDYDYSNYIFVNDFEKDDRIKNIAISLSKKYNLKILSNFKLGYEDKLLDDLGPLGFITAIKNSRYVISNSFHATAFSLIFHTDFLVVKRNEKINVRMEDLLEMFDLSYRLSDNIKDNNFDINWSQVDKVLKVKKNESTQYINDIINLAEERSK
nr:polysaccharide pyruvyl transferase family protein [uncultured Faecalibacillus sp.]